MGTHDTISHAPAQKILDDTLKTLSLEHHASGIPNIRVVVEDAHNRAGEQKGLCESKGHHVQIFVIVWWWQCAIETTR